MQLEYVPLPLGNLIQNQSFSEDVIQKNTNLVHYAG